jgi:hypothetical protein
MASKWVNHPKTGSQIEWSDRPHQAFDYRTTKISTELFELNTRQKQSGHPVMIWWPDLRRILCCHNKLFVVYLAVSATDEPLGEGVSRNDPDIESMVSSLTDDLLLLRVIVSILANWLNASFRRFRFRPLWLRPGVLGEKWAWKVESFISN